MVGPINGESAMPRDHINFKEKENINLEVPNAYGEDIENSPLDISSRREGISDDKDGQNLEIPNAYRDDKDGQHITDTVDSIEEQALVDLVADDQNQFNTSTLVNQGKEDNNMAEEDLSQSQEND
ncbi:hypothetical protein IEQ34_002572 [Dendrobium chrysotoxum]|uniref:Uncharacterized protein n=1 Tax=Dendrobium chrysotoxum TaxID=161865 RepID=A0AAV7HI80_DENCH|nr:hypothetical protein IEQ34_002572 [Dendrobium chrysotoxum]